MDPMGYESMNDPKFAGPESGTDAKKNLNSRRSL